MALIKCPECNKEISDKAGACPHCGMPLDEAFGVEKKSKEKKSAGTKKGSGKNGGYLAGIAIAGFGLIILAVQEFIVGGLFVLAGIAAIVSTYKSGKKD